MYDRGISHPMPAAPTARPPYTTDTGTGSPRFAGGRSSGTVALNPPVELTCDAKPVSVAFAAPCDPDGAACPHATPLSTATTAKAIVACMYQLVRRCIFVLPSLGPLDLLTSIQARTHHNHSRIGDLCRHVRCAFPMRTSISRIDTTYAMHTRTRDVELTGLGDFRKKPSDD